MTSKQRAKLRSLAMGINPLFNIGKGGINDNMVADVSTALDQHELLKINVLRACDCSAKELAQGLAAATESELIQVIGNKLVLYRRSKKEGIKHIEI